MNVPRHDADLTLPRGNDAGTIGTQKLGTSALQISFYPYHVAHRNPFSNTDDQRNTRVRRFHNRICGEWRGDEDQADNSGRPQQGADNAVDNRHDLRGYSPPYTG